MRRGVRSIDAGQGRGGIRSLPRTWRTMSLAWKARAVTPSAAQGDESDGLGLVGQADVSPGDVTMRSYGRAADLYRDACTAPTPAYTAFLHEFASLVPEGEVLEVGAGTGRDALYFRQLGLRVIPTDGVDVFVEMMRNQGLPARLLDIRSGDLGGPYAAVFAGAVLLHLSRAELTAFLERVRRSITPGGVFAFTLKDGDGESWSYAKLDQPRHFTYWREADIRDRLVVTGWEVALLRHVEGNSEGWLFVVAR